MTRSADRSVSIVRGFPSLGLLVHCAGAATVSALLIPPREWPARGVRGFAFPIAYVLLALYWRYVLGWGWLVAVAGSVVVTFLCIVFTWTVVLWVHRRTWQMWFARRGADAAMLLASPRGRGELLEVNSWYAWRRGRGLGTIVAVQALADLPRPFWARAATPELRQLYLEHGGVVDDEDPRGVYFPTDQEVGR